MSGPPSRHGILLRGHFMAALLGMSMMTRPENAAPIDI